MRERRIVSTKAAAKYAGVSTWRVYTWIEKGYIPYIRYPGSGTGKFNGYHIDLDDLDRFIEKCRDRIWGEIEDGGTETTNHGS